MKQFEDQPVLPPQQDTHLGLSRRGLLLGTGGTLVSAALAACTRGAAPTPQQTLENPPAPRQTAEASPASTDSTPERGPELAFIMQAGEDLIAQGEQVTLPDGKIGLRFRSKIQDPRPYTDTDVGASGIARGLMALARTSPKNQRFMDAAGMTGAWLRSVAIHDPRSGGIYWPDYADDGGDVSTTAYSSYDDGAAGIADTLWELWELTGNEEDRKAAIDGVQWLVAQAQITGKTRNGDRWLWDTADGGSSYYEGRGMGVTGIIYALAKFYGRLKDDVDPKVAALAETCKQRVEGGLNYLDLVRDELRDELAGNVDPAQNTDISGSAFPETDTAAGGDGNTNMNSGSLSGQAGIASMYLDLVGMNIFPERAQEFKDKAGRLYTWLDTEAMVLVQADAAAWRLALDPESTDNYHYATGNEEGASGIGRSYLRAHEITGNPLYLERAKQAGNWLILAAKHEANDGRSWPEYLNPTSPLTHANLNNGAAGILVFLRELHRVTKISDYQIAAQRASNWLRATGVQAGGRIYWNDFGKGDNNSGPFSDEKSRHWGTSGILEALLGNVEAF